MNEWGCLGKTGRGVVELTLCLCVTTMCDIWASKLSLFFFFLVCFVFVSRGLLFGRCLLFFCAGSGWETNV